MNSQVEMLLKTPPYFQLMYFYTEMHWPFTIEFVLKSDNEVNLEVTLMWLSCSHLCARV